MAKSQFETPISMSDFAGHVAPFVGMPISCPWRGYGSALFLELGVLHEEHYLPTKLHPEGSSSLEGEGTIMIQWSWRVERLRSIAFGSWSTDRKMDSGIASLEGFIVRDISIEGRIPELVLELSDKRWVHSFSTVEGQPKWAVFLPDGSWISVVSGKLHRNIQNLGTP